MKGSISRVVLPVLALVMCSMGVYHVVGQSQTLPAAPPPESPAKTPYQDAIAASGVVESRTENIAIDTALEGHYFAWTTGI